MSAKRLLRRYGPGVVIVALCIFAVVLARRNRVQAMSAEGLGPRSMGNPAAALLLTEYSDFQCPNCGYARLYVEALLKQYGDRVYFVFRYFPLNIHNKARGAAVAAECAARQGKFWAFHDLLFDHQQEWAQTPDPMPLWGQYAGSLGLDMNKWRECVVSPSPMEAVDRDVGEGSAWQVESTPTLFIGPKRLIGARQIQLFGAGIIERQLKRP
jgi:protein-disulfide isomerase